MSDGARIGRKFWYRGHGPGSATEVRGLRGAEGGSAMIAVDGVARDGVWRLRDGRWRTAAAPWTSEAPRYSHREFAELAACRAVVEPQHQEGPFDPVGPQGAFMGPR